MDGINAPLVCLECGNDIEDGDRPIVTKRYGGFLCSGACAQAFTEARMAEKNGVPFHPFTESAEWAR